MIHTICSYFFTFMLYSFAGWVMETLLYLFRDKRVVKRGFLFGPLCPIYGTGAVLCTAVLYGRVNNIFLVFICGLLLCGTLEYITHFVMEKCFHAMWWDYSTRRFNINGRVYLNGLLIFGAGATLIVKLLQPLVFKLIDIMPNVLLYSLCFALYSILIIDFAATVENLKGGIRQMQNLQSSIIESTQKGVDLTEEQIESIKSNISNSKYVKKLAASMTDNNSVLARMKSQFPDFKIEKYQHVIDIILDKPIESKKRTDIKLYGGVEDNTEPAAEEKE